MRKKLSLLLLLLLIPALAYAWGVAIIGSGGGTSAAGGCDNLFEWHCENVDITLGTPAGCSAGDTTAAATGSPAISNTQKSDGTNSVHINTQDEYYEFAIDTSDLLDPDDFKITFDLYIVSMPVGGTTYLMYNVGGVNDKFYISLDSTNAGIKFYRKAQGTTDGVFVDSLSTGTWLSIEYQGLTGVTGNDHYLNIPDEGSDENDDDLPVMSGTPPTSIKIGESNGSADGEYYIDNIKITTCDKYTRD